MGSARPSARPQLHEGGDCSCDRRGMPVVVGTISAARNAEVGAEGEAGAVFFEVLVEEACAGLVEVDGEEGGFDVGAGRVVDGEFGGDGGKEGGFELVGGGGGGVGDFGEGRVDGEVEVGGFPGVGGPTVMADDFAGVVAGDGWGGGGGGGFGREIGLGGVAELCAFEERQTADGGAGGAGAVFDSYEEVLVGGFAQLQAQAALGGEVAAGEGEEGAHGGVVGVEGDVFVERRDVHVPPGK